MKKYMLSIGVAAAMAFAMPAFASDLVDNGYTVSNPVFESMVFAVDPPMVPANRPNNDGNDVAVTKYRRMHAVNYYQLTTDNTTPRTVLACGYESNVIPVPSKVPIAV